MKRVELQIGIIGAGRMGRLYARIIQESPFARLVAMVGNTQPGCDEAARLFGVPVYAQGKFNLLWERHPEIDTVIVATPEWEHLRPGVSALQRGAHVLLEKPMAHKLSEAKEIAAAARASTATFMLCHSLRFDPRFALMQEAIARDEIGEVQHVYARRNGDQRAAARILGRCHPAYWLSPHDVDMMRWITGAEVRSVQAQAAKDGQQPADAIFATLKFSSGAIGRLENSWTNPPLNGRSRWGVFDVWGTRGTIELSPYEQGLKILQEDGTIAAPDTLELPVLHGKVFGAFPALVHHFLAAARREHPPLVGVEDGLATMRVAAAIKRSLIEKREVFVEEL
jgi:predicted dehydrogenase